MGTVQGNKQIGKIDLSCENSENRIDDVIYQRIYDAGKCTADDHTNGKIHHVAFQGKLFEFLNEFFHILHTLLMYGDVI